MEKYTFKEGMIDFVCAFTEGGANAALPLLGTILAVKHAAKGNKICCALSVMYAVLGTGRLIIDTATGSATEKAQRDAETLKRALKIKPTE